jgi:hypothetical protein
MAPTRLNTLRRRPLAVGLPLAAVGAAAAALMTDTGAAANADRRRAQPAGGPGRRLAGPPLLGVYLGNAPERVAPFEAWLGRRVDGVLGYTAGETWEDIADPGWPLGLWGRIDRPVFWSVPLLPAGGRATLERAARGAYDRHWRACARRLAAFRPQDRHLHVRTGWEFNGDWFPWAAEGKEAAFASAFRRFADTFRAASPRFLLEWNCGLITDGADPECAWPGADWVDVVGMDFYWNPQWTSSDPVRAWEWMLEHRRGLRWHQAFAAAQNRPTTYSEWGVTTDSAEPYLERARAWFDAHDVLFHTYWDSDSAYPGRLSDGSRPRSAAAFVHLFGRGG